MDKKPNFEAFTPPQHQKRLQLRFSSDDLHERMTALAQEDGRSLNNEIMQAIREFVRRRASDEIR